MNKLVAEDLRMLLERSALRDPSLTDEDRAMLFDLALANLPASSLAWLVGRLTVRLRDHVAAGESTPEALRAYLKGSR